MMDAPDLSATRLTLNMPLSGPGKRSGAFGLLWSDNDNPLGHYPLPVLYLAGRPGPTVLLLAGVHGDEYEGPVALQRLYQALQPDDIAGRLIILPMLNAPAMRAGTRVSPLDGGNLNRAFPGAADGGPTAQIAHLVTSALMPVADAVIDLHSGGKASWFVPSALAARGADGGLDAANMALATAFGAPLIWVLGRNNDDRSVNGAATRAGVPCIAAELGGGGAVGPAALAVGEAGLRRCLQHLGVLPGTVPAPDPHPRRVELADPSQRVTAPVAGFYEPVLGAGADIAAAALLGRIHDPDRPDTPPTDIRAPCDGVVLAETRRAGVTPGAFLAFIATQVP